MKKAITVWGVLSKVEVVSEYRRWRSETTESRTKQTKE